MTPTSQQAAARDFVAFWSGKGYGAVQALPGAGGKAVDALTALGRQRKSATGVAE